MWNLQYSHLGQYLRLICVAFKEAEGLPETQYIEGMQNTGRVTEDFKPYPLNASHSEND